MGIQQVQYDTDGDVCHDNSGNVYPVNTMTVTPTVGNVEFFNEEGSLKIEDVIAYGLPTPHMWQFVDDLLWKNNNDVEANANRPLSTSSHPDYAGLVPAIVEIDDEGNLTTLVDGTLINWIPIADYNEFAIDTLQNAELNAELYPAFNQLSDVSYYKIRSA